MSEKEMTVGDLKRAKAKLQEEIAEKIREFNLATGEKIEGCSIQYQTPEAGTSNRGKWLHENGGCIVVKLTMTI